LTVDMIKCAIEGSSEEHYSPAGSAPHCLLISGSSLAVAELPCTGPSHGSLGGSLRKRVKVVEVRLARSKRRGKIRLGLDLGWGNRGKTLEGRPPYNDSKNANRIHLDKVAATC
jgi:hypothetical protein